MGFIFEKLVKCLSSENLKFNLFSINVLKNYLLFKKICYYMINGLIKINKKQKLFFIITDILNFIINLIIDKNIFFIFQMLSFLHYKKIIDAHPKIRTSGDHLSLLRLIKLHKTLKHKGSFTIPIMKIF